MLELIHTANILCEIDRQAYSMQQSCRIFYASVGINKMTMTPFAIVLYGQCCRRDAML